MLNQQNTEIFLNAVENSATSGPSSRNEKEKMTELVKKKKVRGGHCAHATKLLGTARNLLEGYDRTGRTLLRRQQLP